MFDEGNVGVLVAQLPGGVGKNEAEMREKEGLFVQQSSEFVAGSMMSFVYNWEVALASQHHGIQLYALYLLPWAL